MERLQKILAGAGLGSRRQCEEIISAGRVTVNGEVIDKMGVQVDPEKDIIHVDGDRIRTERKAFYLLNKPKGYVVTQSDEFGRKRAADLLVGVEERVFPVGRLDMDTEGLLIFTNDGDLANYLTHPRYGVPKTYLALIRGAVQDSDLEKLRGGLYFEEGKVQADTVSIRFKTHETTTVEMTLREGRNREVRRMFVRLGYKVKNLKRVRIGNLTDRGLSVGHYRYLRRNEIEALQSGDFSKVRARGKRKRKQPRKKKNLPSKA